MKNPLYLLDTSVLLNIVRGNDLGKFIQQTCGLINPATRSLISIVSHGELWAMAERRNWQKNKREALTKILESIVTVDLNAGEIIRTYVEVDKANQSVASGARQLSNNDMWIAATARAADAVLLTTDKDFLHLNPKIVLVQYVDPKSRLATASSGNQPRIR